MRLQPYIEPEAGFTPRNTSGLDGRELAALNRALDRLMAHGLSDREAKLALHAAVAHWLQPRDAADADLERLLAWR
jgi:hypothetical protein